MYAGGCRQTAAGGIPGLSTSRVMFMMVWRFPNVLCGLIWPHTLSYGCKSKANTLKTKRWQKECIPSAHDVAHCRTFPILNETHHKMSLMGGVKELV